MFDNKHIQLYKQLMALASLLRIYSQTQTFGNGWLLLLLYKQLITIEMDFLTAGSIHRRLWHRAESWGGNCGLWNNFGW